jgi:peptide/nickel transport system substrate-binding protein
MPDVPVEKITALAGAADHKLIPLTSNRYNYVAFNCARPILRDRRVRRALSCAINRPQVLSTYGNEGNAITGPFPSDSPNRCDTCAAPYQEYNPDLARRLLQEAGWLLQPSERRVNAAGQTLAIKLTTFSESGTVPGIVAERIRGFWEDVGVTATVEYLNPQEYNQRVFGARDFDASFGLWSFFLTPNLSPTFRSDGSQNFINYSNPEIDLRLDSIPRLETDERTLLYHRIHKMISDDAPYAFLYTIKRYTLLNTSIDIGPNVDPFNFFRRVNQWSIRQ